jgi:hypothetical protein
MPWPLPHWPPAPPPVPPSRDSSALAVTLATAVLLVVLAIAASVILLVANGDSSHTGVLTQSTVTNPVGENERPAAP